MPCKSLYVNLTQVDVVQALIRDRVAVASSQETGRDLEHCVVLIRKFDDFQKVYNLAKSSMLLLSSDYV